MNPLLLFFIEFVGLPILIFYCNTYIKRTKAEQQKHLGFGEAVDIELHHRMDGFEKTEFVCKNDLGHPMWVLVSFEGKFYIQGSQLHSCH